MVTVQKEPMKDRRVQKTRGLLLEALVSLIHEKSYDSIAVKEILHRANVGRSTFYTHFPGKDGLLDSGIRDILSAARPQDLRSPVKHHETMLWFSLPMFQYIGRHRHPSHASKKPGEYVVVHERLQEVLAALIADDIRNVPGSGAGSEARVLIGILPQFVALTFVLVLNWWVENDCVLRPDEVNRLFRELVAPAFARVLG